MKLKVILIDKDQHLIESMGMLVELLNFQPVTFSNWNYKIKSIAGEEIAAIIVNLESLIIKPYEIVQNINSLQSEAKEKIPVILTYESNESSTYNSYSILPHCAMLKKRYTLEEFFQVLKTNVHIGSIKSEITILEEELEEIRYFKSEFEEWLNQLEKVISK